MVLRAAGITLDSTTVIAPEKEREERGMKKSASLQPRLQWLHGFCNVASTIAEALKQTVPE
ncbi:MAG: hypothetical protein MI684_10595 [Chlorobiales bacterium]|nr:hypothetical protein [Chlorobiales bacterium]